MSETILYWFKNDQRLTDNEALFQAIGQGKQIIPLYIIDPRSYNTQVYGERKTGIIRFKFLHQSLNDLQDSLKTLGADLDIRVGYPEDVLPKIVNDYKVSRIYCEQEYADEELQLKTSIKSKLPGTCELVSYWGKTLYHIDDIPYAINEIPKTSKAYRINTSKKAEVRETFSKIGAFDTPKNYKFTPFPDPVEVGFTKEEIESAGDPFVDGGETKALERLRYYTFDSQLLTSYKWSRNKSLGLDYSSKLSPYLALGNISPRTIYEMVKLYESGIKKNISTWWLVFEVVWRDYFTFKGMHYGSLIFRTEGFKNKKLAFDNNEKLFSAWKEGKTGIPFIDASMRQLNTTGYMSNRGRVNCASFLVHDLKIDWTWGASYFESKLIDYDVSANWLNWHMQAYEIWYTNPVNQALKYKTGEYIKTYILELQNLDENQVLAPWLFEELNHSYPKPVVLFQKWTRAINLIKKANGIED
ncbi:DASH family cryptochrome [Nonlabens antarcticus]|uniref:DASH family cryptochrome n=1 Tax=Nonlabens antarcticus TaxID=392714 RepID=UPI001891E6BA|nr:DASH family cryptochrome [Nonlabens antarcticus]